MNQFDRERERIGRLREEGYLTAYEHQRRAAMIDRSEKRAANAAARAEAKGVQVVMNRCPKIEWGRLSGEISWGGINSRILSAKKPTMMAGFQKLSVDKDG